MSAVLEPPIATLSQSTKNGVHADGIEKPEHKAKGASYKKIQPDVSPLPAQEEVINNPLESLVDNPELEQSDPFADLEPDELMHLHKNYMPTLEDELEENIELTQNDAAMPLFEKAVCLTLSLRKLLSTHRLHQPCPHPRRCTWLLQQPRQFSCLP